MMPVMVNRMAMPMVVATVVVGEGCACETCQRHESCAPKHGAAQPRPRLRLCIFDAGHVTS
jgi:hypothetical protein